MTKEVQEKHFDNFVAEMRKTMLSKGDDYANEDRLSNFKLAGAMAGGTAEQNCLHHMATKMARLKELILSEKEPNNEPVKDSLKDLAIYAVMLSMIIADSQSKMECYGGFSLKDLQVNDY